ncbi:hypothetical protein AB0F93_03685 [Micromonospora tulbaghiae]|uniref:hypothetical protein n=1 Tax=Micromonospora tulbaghiae TaxID=479978 RepID=UPI0033235557
MAERLGPANPYPVAEVRSVLDRALSEMKRTRRHPAEVTSDRLGDASRRWGAVFTGAELDAIGQIRQALEEIAEGKRGGAA